MTQDRRSAVDRILHIDPWLTPFRGDLELRVSNYGNKKGELLKAGESLSDFANGDLWYGFHHTEEGWIYREWAPAADQLYLVGDFNQWDPHSHPLTRIGKGDWEIRLPEGSLAHRQKVKVIVNYGGQDHYKIPLYIHRVVQEKNENGEVNWVGQVWDPEPFPWTDQGFKKKKGGAPLIYESHVGIAQEEARIGSYREFADKILPRIKADGYDTIQLMAIMQHPYYASFGYQVTSFFAASSWFGEPEDLKYLVNKAHQMGIAVLMDLVHSHASKNQNEGIAYFDGSQEQFFCAGDRGFNRQWDSMCFNYGKNEVLHFLLSNLKFWLENFHLDGFRFDGVTAMLYWDHGMGTDFNSYDRYFSMNTNTDAVTYLSLAAELIHGIKPEAILIAEDMSGMPGLCLPVQDGGMGFDYRLAMGVPDMWIRLMKTNDYDWNMQQIYHELTTRRPREKKISYAESHDQALVGDKTLFFWMADANAYWHMEKSDDHYLIDRAIALHKMIRLITLTTGGDGYLNFMGNEFGHPEWIDFPRQENGWSYKYARRQWHLVDDENLKYQYLNHFDNDMLSLAKTGNLMGPSGMQLLWIDEDRLIIAYRKNNLVFLYNFHPTNSCQRFFLPVHQAGKYQCIFSTDREEYGGFGRIDENYIYHTSHHVEMLHSDLSDMTDGIIIYSPARTALVLKKISSNPDPEEREAQESVDQMVKAERIAQKTLEEQQKRAAEIKD